MPRSPIRTIGLERVEIERLRRRVGRLFAALQEVMDDSGGGPGAWSPPVDLCETSDAVIVRVELPGIEASEVELTLTNGGLRIGGRKSGAHPAASSRIYVPRGLTAGSCAPSPCDGRCARAGRRPNSKTDS